MKYLFKNPKNNHAYKHGKSINPPKRHCTDCGVLLSESSYHNKTKRCRLCSKKYFFKKHTDFAPMLGKKHSLKTKRKISSSGKKRFENIKERERMSLALKGKNNPRWLDGRSFKPYDEKFNKRYKETIRFRDGYKCQLCGCLQVENGRALDVHHIDYDKMNTHPNNNITLCRSCNAKVNSNRKHWTKYFKKLINRGKICLQILKN